MKKFTIITLLMLSVGAATVQAQNVRFGIKAGGSVDAFSEDGLDNQDAKWGFQAGILSEINFSERFALQPEVLYATRGADYQVGLVDAEERLNYIDVPVLVKYKPLKFLNVYVGPQVSFLTHGKYEYQAEGASYEIDDQDAFNGVDVGFAVGGGLDLGSLFFDIRYNMGYVEVHDDYPLDQLNLGEADAKNYGFQLSVGYFF